MPVHRPGGIRQTARHPCSITLPRFDAQRLKCAKLIQGVSHRNCQMRGYCALGAIAHFEALRPLDASPPNSN